MPPLSRLNPLAALLIGLAALTACAPSVTVRDGRAPAAAPAAAPAEPVTVALLAPMGAASQDAAQLGQALVNAAQLAQEDLGNPLLQLLTFDTAGDPGTAAAAARQAMAEGADLILGPLFAETTRAVAGSAGSGVNIISFSTDSSIAGGPIFLSGVLPEMAARRIASYAGARGLEPLAILYPETDYGRVALAGIEAAAGPAVVARTSYPRTSDALPPAAQAFAERVRQTGARGLVLAESGQALQYLGSVLTDSGVRQPEYRYLGLGEWDTRATLDAPELTGGWFASTDPSALKAFVDRYQARYGSVPPRLAFLGYDAVQIAGQLLDEARRAGSGDPFGRAAITRPQGFRGALGPIRFLPDGRGERGLAILEVGPRSFQVIDPAPGTFGAGT